MLRTTILLLLLVVCSACIGPPGRTITAEEYAEIEKKQATSTSSAALDIDRRAIGDGVTLTDRAASLTRERIEISFELAELSSRRAHMDLEAEDGRATRALTLSQARERLTTRRAEVLFFKDVERALLLAEDALEVREAQDRLLEIREELAQLELMYGPDPSDATAEIVVARTRRRVVRVEERLRLAGLRSRRLQEIELPKRLHEGALSLQTAEEAVAGAERGLALGDLKSATSERALDHEEALLKLRLETLERKEQRLEEDQRSWERGEPIGARP